MLKKPADKGPKSVFDTLFLSSETLINNVIKGVVIPNMLADYLKTRTIETAVEMAGKLNDGIKALNTVLEVFKAHIRKEAVSTLKKPPSIEGGAYKAGMSYPTSRSIAAKDLFNKMLEEDLITVKVMKNGKVRVAADDFFALCSVSVPEAEKFMGTASIKDIIKVTDKTPSVSLKEK